MTDDVVCERTYQVETADGVRPVPVRWFRPAPDPRGDWGCRLEIHWPHRPHRTVRVAGVDSAQALYLAMQMAAVELYTSELPVFWWEPDDVLHLPVQGAIADLEAVRTRGRG